MEESAHCHRRDPLQNTTANDDQTARPKQLENDQQQDEERQIAHVDVQQTNLLDNQEKDAIQSSIDTHQVSHDISKLSGQQDDDEDGDDTIMLDMAMDQAIDEAFNITYPDLSHQQQDQTPMDSTTTTQAKEYTPSDISHQAQCRDDENVTMTVVKNEETIYQPCPSDPNHQTLQDNDEENNQPCPSDPNHQTLQDKDEENNQPCSSNSNDQTLPDKDEENNQPCSSDSNDQTLQDKDEENNQPCPSDSNDQTLQDKDEENNQSCPNDSNDQTLPDKDEENNQPCSSDPNDQTLQANDEENQPSPMDPMVATNFYLIKWIQWKETSTPIVTQNINGPCPLIAIINILLLTRKITFSAGREYITSEELMENLVNTLLTLRPKAFENSLDYDQNVNDAISSLSVLETGVDINVKFGGINQFEWTCNLIVFDLLDINLYHGWLVDPQNQEEKSIIGNRSYNELVEMIISSKSSNDSSRITEGLIAEQFLNSTASQLTYHGLYTLYEELKPEQLCVLFRNNHYSTLYKHKDELFILVTDIGYSTEKEIVWETLSNIEGDSSLVNHEFKTVSSQGRTENFDVNQAAPVDEQRLIESDINNGSTNLSIQYDPNNDRVSQEKLDHMIALQEQKELDGQTTGINESVPHNDSTVVPKALPEDVPTQDFTTTDTVCQGDELSSEALAWRLQFDEYHHTETTSKRSALQSNPMTEMPPAGANTSSRGQMRAENPTVQASSQSRPGQSQSTGKRSDGNCCIL